EDKKEIQTVNINRAKKDVYNQNMVVKDNLINNQYLSPFTALNFSFQTPIKSINLSKIKLFEDSIPLVKFKLSKDSVDFLRYKFDFPWEEDKRYNLRFETGAFVGFLGLESKPFDRKIMLAKKDNYGSLEVKITTEEPANYVLDLLNAQKLVIRSFYFSKDTTITVANFEEGKYFIRVVYDKNKNGIWDSGNLKRGIQAEHIWYNPKESSIRGNWERKEAIIIPKEERD
ncbi:MAG: hypothetical protein K2Q03_08345, partial [Sphingobacteriaceae bacterium]|nr:hypothetical protein [Sphingobacteriaceae bacterium]